MKKHFILFFTLFLGFNLINTMVLHPALPQLAMLLAINNDVILQQENPKKRNVCIQAQVNRSERYVKKSSCKQNKFKNPNR